MNDATWPSEELEQTPAMPKGDAAAQTPAISEADARELLARAMADPFQAERLNKLREECYVLMADLVREVAVSLSVPENAASPTPQFGVPTNFLSLKNMSRQMESDGRQRKEAAQAMVMGALLNRHNPDWDPFDPATDRSSRENLILALLQPPPPPAPVEENPPAEE